MKGKRTSKGIAVAWIGVGIGAALAGLVPSWPASAQTSGDRLAKCVPPGMEKAPVSSSTPRQRIMILTCAQREVAREINSQTPIRVDDSTTLYATVAAGTTLIYNMRTTLRAEDVTPAFRAAQDEATRTNVCSLPDMRQLLSLGAAYEYLWWDQSGHFLHSVKIERC